MQAVRRGIVFLPHPGVARRRCARDGYDGSVSRSRTYCCSMCDALDVEFSRLQALYETAGDPTLRRDAWRSIKRDSDGGRP